MNSGLILTILIALVIGAVAASPRAYAWVRAGFGLMREEKELRQTRRDAPGTTLDDYAMLCARAEGGTQRSSGGPENAQCESAPVDDRTWIDLNLDQVFVELDHTSSRPGQQYLRQLLRAPAQSVSRISALNASVASFERDPAASSAIKSALYALDDPRASHLVRLMYGDLPDRPAFWWIFPMLTLCAIALAATVYFWPRALFGLIGIAVINVALQVFYRPRIEALLPAIHELPAFLSTAKKVAALGTELFPEERATLSEGFAQLGVLRRATSWLKFEPSQQSSELVGSLYTYVSMLLMLDMTAFVFTINSAKHSRPTLQRMFEAIGQIDAAQSIGTWRKSLPQWAIPEFTSPRKELVTTGLMHPLIKEAVGNDVVIRAGGALITGSNMSGKTTFIRALGVNAILAQSVGTVVATSWRAPLLRVRSSIARADNLLEGKSYYLAEVESIRTLIQAKDDGAQHLFLVDELFRGTNTAERVAGAYAVLEYLNLGDDIVVVATHDTELLGMLGDAYAPHHFREDISGDSLTFDFKLRDGQATTRNAIALLELMKYPPEVVARARHALR